MLRTARALLLVVVVAAAATALLGVGGVAAKRITSPTAALYATVQAEPSVALAAPQPPAIPTPASGSMLLAGEDGGTLAASAADVIRPTGSVAKTMTALLTLRAHPLAPGQDGPVLTLTETDAALYREAIAGQGSAVPVRAGEQLSERQLLLALLLPSANNIAETLARWVGGTREAFVSQLNAAAEAGGMRATHFADPSGYSPATTSTASDLVRLGRAALRNPALVELVGTRSAVLPDGTVLENLDLLLAAAPPHWIGIKTGWTPRAGGCLLFAATAPVGAAAVPVTLVGAVLGQPPDPAVDRAHPELGGAFTAAATAMKAALAGYSTVDLASVLARVTGHLGVPWGRGVGIHPLATSRVVLVRGPLPLRLRVSPVPVSAPAAAGALVAQVTGSTDAGPDVTWGLVTDAPVPAAPWWWRLLHG